MTIELKLNFIAPAKDGTLTATAKVISRGRRVVVGDMDVINDRQTLIAHGTGTCMIVRPRK